MQISQIGGKNWLTGVEWEILPGELSIKEEVKRAAEGNNTPWGVIVSHDVSSETTHEKRIAVGLTNKKPSVPSAAVYLALANQKHIEENIGSDYPDWVVIEDVGNDKYWIGLTKEGVPAPQYDVVVSITEIMDRMRDLLVNDTYEVFSTSQHIIDMLSAFKNVKRRSLNDLTSGIKKAPTFQKKLGIPPSVIYGALGVVALMVAGYATMEFTQAWKFREKLRQAAIQREMEQRAKREQYEFDMRQYQTQKVEFRKIEVNKIVTDLSGETSRIINAFYNNVGNTPVSTHGWNMTEIQCYTDTGITSGDIKEKDAEKNKASKGSLKLACDYLFQRTGLSTVRMLLEDYPTAKINGDKAVVTKQVAIDSSHIRHVDDSVIQNFSDATNWNKDIISQLQLLKIVEIDHEIKPSVEITFETIGMPVSPEQQEAGTQPSPPETIGLGVAKGQIMVKGDNAELLRELADNVDFKNTSVSKITFKPQQLGKISWEAELTYYINNQNGGIGASNTSGLSSDAVDYQPSGPSAPSRAMGLLGG